MNLTNCPLNFNFGKIALWNFDLLAKCCKLTTGVIFFDRISSPREVHVSYEGHFSPFLFLFYSYLHCSSLTSLKSFCLQDIDSEDIVYHLSNQWENSLSSLLESHRRDYNCGCTRFSQWWSGLRVLVTEYMSRDDILRNKFTEYFRSPTKTLAIMSSMIFSYMHMMLDIIEFLLFFWFSCFFIWIWAIC